MMIKFQIWRGRISKHLGIHLSIGRFYFGLQPEGKITMVCFYLLGHHFAISTRKSIFPCFNIALDGGWSFHLEYFLTRFIRLVFGHKHICQECGKVFYLLGSIPLWQQLDSLHYLEFGRKSKEDILKHYTDDELEELAMEEESDKYYD